MNFFFNDTRSNKCVEVVKAKKQIIHGIKNKHFVREIERKDLSDKKEI